MTVKSDFVLPVAAVPIYKAIAPVSANVEGPARKNLKKVKPKNLCVLDSDQYKAPVFDLIYRYEFNIIGQPQISSSGDAYKIFQAEWDEAKMDFVEQSKLMLLNSDCRVLGICDLSTGGTRETVMDRKILLAASLVRNATAIVIAHNHPSGSPKPSRKDVLLTKQLKKAAQAVDIVFLDHLVITRNGYYSLADEGDI